MFNTYVKTKQLYWASGIVSICGIIFEVLFGAVGSYVLGDSVRQYTITIGLFLTGMGVGASISERIGGQLLKRFIQVELLIALIGGFSTLTVFGLMAYEPPGTEALALYVFTLVIGGLTGVELPILIRKATEIGVTLKRSAARVLFFDYAGSLIGSILFILWLRPMLGLVKTAFVVATVNAAVAVWVLVSFRYELIHVRLLKRLSVIVLVLVASGVIWSEDAFLSFEQRLYAYPMIRQLDTQYQRVVVTRELDDTRLYIDGNLQFSSSDEYRYHESLVHPAMAAAKHQEKVLILGGGDGLAAREVLKYPQVKSVTLVDIDRELISFVRHEPILEALNKGALDDKRMHLVFEDAFNYIKNRLDCLYDVIIIDLPDPNNESLNKLYTREFYQLVRARLAPDGAMVVQSTSPFFAREVYWTIDTTIKAAGFHTINYHLNVPSFGDWGFVLGTNRKITPDQLAFNEEIKTRYLSADVFFSMTRFGKDVAPPVDAKGSPEPLRPNTMDYPVLIPMYEQAWKYY